MGISFDEKIKDVEIEEKRALFCSVETHHIPIQFHSNFCKLRFPIPKELRMKFLKELFLIVSISALGLSCDANKEREKRPPQPDTLDVSTENTPSVNSYLKDSLNTGQMAQKWSQWEDYLFLYSESDSLHYLDSSRRQIDAYLEKNDFPRQYLVIGTTYEVLGHLDIAKHYYREGKTKVEVWKTKPEFADQPKDYLNLMDQWFSILLKEPIDLKQLEELEQACKNDPTASMYETGAQTREELFDLFCL